jgi:hypothetical protein
LGVTEIETSVALVTVSAADADVWPLKVALMPVDPASRPAASPTCETDAFAVFVDTHEHEGEDVTS